MKNLLVINPIPLICSIKKLIFVFILLLILPLTGCKSVVKETDVEKPVRLVSPNGDVYVGEVMSGEPHGQGTLTFPGGEKYVGEFKDGEYHGQGTWTMSNGVKYVGEWKYHKKHGQGTITSPDGVGKLGGEFKNGKPWNGTEFDKYGNIIGKWMNGVYQ